jgi:trigger factor
VTITKEVERLEHSAVKLTLKVSSEDVRSEYDKIVADYAKTIQIPGFRKGKVPRDILIRKFAEAFKGETLAHVMEHAISETFDDESFPKEDRPLPYSRPEMKDDPKKLELDLENDLEFSIFYDTLPVFTVGKWQGLEVEAPDVSVEEDDISRELEVVRERNAIVLDREDGAPCIKGDVVTVNYAELSEGGEALSGTERQDFVFTLGSGNNIFKFDDEITGMKKGETRDITKSYPEDFNDKDLAGQTRNIRVTVTAVKERQLPELDDDLAQDVDEKYQTLDDLKASIRERLNKNLEKKLREIKINKILEKVLETTPIEIPESMLNIELESRWRNFAGQLGVNPEELVRSMSGSGSDARQTIFDEWKGGALESLRTRLVIDALILDQKLTVSDKELEKQFQVFSDESALSIENIKEYYESGKMKDYIDEEIKERNLFDLLLSKNTVKTGEKKKYLDIVPNYQ